MFVKKSDVWIIIKFKKTFEKNSQRFSKMWEITLKKSLFLKNVNCDEKKTCRFKNDIKILNDIFKKTENCENDNDTKIEKCATWKTWIIENDKNLKRACAKKQYRFK